METPDGSFSYKIQDRSSPYYLKSQQHQRRPPLPRRTSAARQQALMIKAESHIVQLESELSSLRKEATADKIKINTCSEVGSNNPEHYVERLHKLQQERCTLLEELSVVKEKLCNTEQELLTLQEKYQESKESFEAECKVCRHQVEGLVDQVQALDSLNDEMERELNEAHLVFSGEHLNDVDQLNKDHSRSLEVMRKRLKELENVENELLKSQTEIKHLERQLRTYRQDTLFVDGMKDNILRCETLDHQIQLLKEENVSLRQDRANTDLLRYQVQNLQKRCEKFDELGEKLVHLDIENRNLKSIEASGENMSTPSLLVHLTKLQQREIVAMKRIGELTTELKVVQQELGKCWDTLKETQILLKKEKETSLVWEEKFQRLDRRLIFVTKERDGCVNVLNSYKCDSGVDVMMRNFMTEMEQQLKRSKQRITELESEVAKAKTITE